MKILLLSFGNEWRIPENSGDGKGGIYVLGNQLSPMAKKMITVGTIKSTPVDHRRIIKEALLTNATAIILFHNHPSGTPAPSVADINETNKLRKACDIFDI